MRICHCRNVSDRHIESALGAGARSVSQVCRATGAGTTCGGCVPAVREIVETRRDLPMAIAGQVPSTIDPLPLRTTRRDRQDEAIPAIIERPLAAE